MRPALSLATLIIGAALAPLAQAASDACDAPHQTVLRPPAAQVDASAVWLDAARLVWPGSDGRGEYFLKSGSGQIRLAPANGAAAEIPVQFRYLPAGPVFTLPDRTSLKDALRGELLLVQSVDGQAVASTRIQHAAALDALYGAAAGIGDFGVTVSSDRTAFKVWAPTALDVKLCLFKDSQGKSAAEVPMQRDPGTGAWSVALPRSLAGQYYSYMVEVQSERDGLVRNLVADPYAVSAGADSQRAYIADLDAPALKPAGWDRHKAPATVKRNTDMVIYELHVRDFSINDPSVPAGHRGKYMAFTDGASHGMRHLKALARAGMTDIHLLPVFDYGSVPETNCVTPQPSGAPDSESQQAATQKVKEEDCFNWGYDPVLYSAPEGSFSSNAHDGAARVRELRAMVMALHKAGLRVGMDVVYNHTFRAGQDRKSVLDRIVPGYYHRLNEKGVIERSTCCDNTATENLMMGKLMVDSAVLWTRHYKMDSFRFDLMGHQPRKVMEDLQKAVDRAAGKPVQLIGEGWNFGEVADGKRFVQASQLSLNGSGIGTFSDRARDAVRGGGAGDNGRNMIERKGFVTGATGAELQRAADMVKVGLAGSVRSYPATAKLMYGDQPAAYGSEPGEVVNYVENHDNQTLFDINVMKLPVDTTTADRARVQMVAAAINAFSQGVAYYHAGIDTLRSKSLDRNSFNSGDWFNRIDWTYQDNYFGTGLPPKDDNGADWPLMKPFLANPAIKPAQADIAFARDVFRDLLAIRASTTLFRLHSSAEIAKRLAFHASPAAVIAASIDGKGYPGAKFKAVHYIVNADTQPHSMTVKALQGKQLRLHPAHRADPMVKQASFASATGTLSVPARTAVVFVE
jgi:pullulanase/glycogen debranching enzyme